MVMVNLSTVKNFKFFEGLVPNQILLPPQLISKVLSGRQLKINGSAASFWTNVLEDGRKWSTSISTWNFSLLKKVQFSGGSLIMYL